MKSISQEILLNRLNNFKLGGHHIDSRLMDEVKNGGCFYIIELNDEESFLSLIWQEIDDTRLLTPKGETRRLLDVAERFIENKYSFEDLSKSIGMTSDKHKPEWFEKCIPINSDFKYDNFGLITIVPANDSERKQCPKGSFYIYDGIHKSLVLSTKLLKKEIGYQKIEALLLIPRR
ncbi:MAG: hypothetical protein K9J16_08205 [Melioribacteraceae bacterium]|nr:hypothetical protein [Melioribacteraceae bacterium]MCF8353885.1 hypothetical protein [Melioribacteraceae bacterium]MCF8393118.1 hypothetical protein [Melioribacteraceae bacterium]MCF8419237.1 hypothetical protein [Melioribacteraceae bacterium]